MRIILCLCALTAASAQRVEPQVKTTQGNIIGNYIQDGDYIVFYGVEYGGSTYRRRFQAPTDPDPTPTYETIIAANKGVICAQPTSQGIIGIENCLVLDIYTKNLTIPKPVFVWLEGEEYEKTSNTSYPFENLVQEGLVVVSVKYRLSIFGFLCLGVPDAPGNAGLKDVLHALKWIQTNIAVFGGDPNNVLLAGHGSGAAMVDLITLSPLSRNLVHKALVLSGSSLAPWAISYDPINDAEKVAAKLKYTDKKPNELAKLLQATDFRVLGGALSGFDYYNNPPLFAPCIENSQLKGTVLDDAPINILRSGKYNDIPYVAGFTEWEGTMRAEQSAHSNWYFNMRNQFEKFLPADLEFKSNTDKMNVNKIIRNLYFGEKPMDNILDFLEYEGDVLVLVPITRGVKERAMTSKSPVRVFEFAYSYGKKNTTSDSKISVPGAKHGDILNYLFDYELGQKNSSPSFAVSSRIVAFAKTGSAQPPETVEWKPVSSHSLYLLYLNGGEVQPQVTLFKEEVPGNINENRTEFWNKIYESYYRQPSAVKSSANILLSFAVVIIIAQIMIKLL